MQTTTSRSSIQRLAPIIQRTARRVCSRRALNPDERDDFESFLFEVFLGRGARLLTQYRGEGALDSYLRVAIERLLVDYRRQRWGSWRPSARARRLGSTAVELERLVERDGFSRWEAIRHIRFNRGAPLSEVELLDLAGQLPNRARRRFEGEEKLCELPEESADASPASRCLQEDEAVRVRRALAMVIAELEPRERRLLAQRFARGWTVAEIARRSGQNQRQLYRKLERLLARLRQRLESLGVDGAAARTVLLDPT